MIFQDISIKDKRTFDSFLANCPLNISEMNFTRLFCWRKSEKSKFTIIDNHILVSFWDGKSNRFYQPIGEEPESIIAKILDQIPCASFAKIDELVAYKLKNAFQIDEDRNSFDYIYSVEELRKLSGKKFSNLRNAVNINRSKSFLMKKFDFNEEMTNKCIDLYLLWSDSKEKYQEDVYFVHEALAIKEYFSNARALGSIGFEMRDSINNEMIGFEIGEQLNANTFTVHFGKHIYKYKGLGSYVLYELARTMQGNIEYINYQDDLGIEGLRFTKSHIGSSKLIKKYSIFNKK
jgi:hypothetical protein